jgi:separase
MKTYTVAYDFLAQARNLLGIDDSRNEITAQQANFMRCVSSAFHHLAGTLYQEGIPAPAIRFLKEACVLGMRALGVYRSGGRVNESESAGVGWRLLENQLYRRWELLGICYSKVGDRKVSFWLFLFRDYVF